MIQTECDQSPLQSLLEENEQAMRVVISDPSMPDNPMMVVSEEFEAQTDYSAEEAISQND